jgi:DUF4097 and DUF4098 domain-containing protein YvlB
MSRKFSLGNWMMAAAVLLFAANLAAQESKHECNNNEGSSDKPHVCEVREVTIAAVPELKVDAAMNGGIAVEGADRNDIAIRATVVAWGDNENEAREEEQRIRIATDGGSIRAEGAHTKHYAVSYKLTVPRATAVDLHANNGGISLASLNSHVRFETTNGGVNLREMAGDVKGETTNGGVKVKLDGARWNGAGLDVTTTNGGIRAVMPANYAAHLEAATVNGGLHVDFPITVSGSIRNRVSTDLNGGGPAIHLETTNGGVRIGNENSNNDD